MLREGYYDYDSDPAINAQWNAAGKWGKTVDEHCEYDCDPPTLRIGYSSRVDVGEGFSDWSDYDYTNILTATHEIQVRVRFEITLNNRAGVVRYRQVISSESESAPAQTLYQVGETHAIVIPPDATGTMEVLYEFVPCAPGEQAALVGPPGRADIQLSAKTQSASLKMRGFRQYADDSPAIKIYRRETVSSGGDPGCLDEARPARVYSGHQAFSASIASEANGWLADPAGAFEDALSSDLREDKHASTPFGNPSKTIDFGTTSFPSATTKSEAETYACGGNVQSKTLALVLSDPYPPDAMTGAVDAALDTQEGLGYTIAIDASNETPVPVHRSFIDQSQTRYERVRTTEIRADATPLTVFSNSGAAVNLHILCDVVTRSLSGGDPSTTTRAFAARLYAEGDITGPLGRDSHQPSGAEIPVASIPSPWEGVEYAGSEVLLTNIRVKPHALVCRLVPFVEPTSVLTEDVDGE